jgi:hypothetical protein
MRPAEFEALDRLEQMKLIGALKVEADLRDEAAKRAVKEAKRGNHS